MAGLVVVIFANFNSDRSRDRELTALIVEEIALNDRERCLTAVENRANNRANWIVWYDLLERYLEGDSPDTVAALEEARRLLDETSPMLDPSSCYPTAVTPEPVASSSTTTTGD